MDSFLDPSILFARTTEIVCAGGFAVPLPFVPVPIPPNRDTAHISLADGNRLHIAWTQEIHADEGDGKGLHLKFTITWLFTKTRTLSERLQVMAQPNGEGVTWYIFSPEGHLLQTKRGSWETPSKNLWPNSQWAKDALWGAANGRVGFHQGSLTGGFPMPKDFWGTGWIEAESEVWCELYWMEGKAHKALNLVNEIRLESTPLLAVPALSKSQVPPKIPSSLPGVFPRPGRFTPYRMANGQLVLVVQEVMLPTDFTELILTVVNGFEFRNFTSPVVSVEGCVRVPPGRFTNSDDEFGEPTSGVAWSYPQTPELPLYVEAPTIYYLRIIQRTNMPAARNRLTIWLLTNIPIGGQYNGKIELTNLAGAQALSGPVALLNPSTGTPYLLFAASIRGPPGFGHWDNGLKKLTLYAVGLQARETEISFELEIENPSTAQDPPVISGSIVQGITLSTIAIADPNPLKQALRVAQAYFTDSTEMRQDTDNPASLNTISVHLGVNVDIRPSSALYTDFVITFSNMQGAMLPSGNVALTSPALAPGGGNVGEADSASYFKAGPAGQPGYGLWDNDAKVLKLWLVKEWQSSKLLGLSFQVNNAPLPQRAPNITIHTTGVIVLFPANRSPCIQGFCRMRTRDTPPPEGVGGPLEILRPMLNASMGQSSPYPCAVNTLTVTLRLNVELVPPGSYALPNAGEFKAGSPVGISIVFTGLHGASSPNFRRWLPSTLSSFGQDAECVDISDSPAKCMEVDGPDSGYFRKVAKWRNHTSVLNEEVQTMTIFVKSLTPRSSLVFTFQVVNNRTGQPSPNVTVATTGVVIAPTLLQKGHDSSHYPLLVHTPVFELKNIGQTTPYPGAQNQLLITLALNVNVRTRCDFYDAVYFEMSGFKEGEAWDGTLPYQDPVPSGTADTMSSRPLLGALVNMTTNQYQAGLLYWHGRNGFKRYSSKLMQDVPAGKRFMLQINVVNAASAQESPDIKILTTGLAILQQSMNRDVTTVLAGIYQPHPSWAAPLKLIEPRFILKHIGQTFPFPGNNTIRVTMSLNIDLFPYVRRCKQRAFRGWVAGERGYKKEIDQETGLAIPISGRTIFPLIPEADRDVQRSGVTGFHYSRVCSPAKTEGIPTKHPAGTPCLTDADCQIADAQTALELENSFCVDAECHEDEWMQPVVTIDTLTGPVQPSGPIQLRDFSSNVSAGFFASGDGERSVGQWSRVDANMRLYIANATRAGIRYAFEFTLQNPLLAQNSPLVKLRLDYGNHIPPEAMVKDLSTVLPVQNAQPGDAAPLRVYSIEFSYAKIGQASPYPFSVNSITVTLVTNMKLTAGSMVSIAAFSGAIMTGIDDFDAAGERVKLRGSNASMFTAFENCVGFDSRANPALRECAFPGKTRYRGMANFDEVKRSLKVYTTEELEANTPYTFSFALRNPGVGQRSPGLAIAIEIGGLEFPSAVIERDLGMKAPLEVEGALFVTKDIGQTVPYPSALNDIGVTLSFNVPIPMVAEPRLTIAGLRGLEPYGPSPDPMYPTLVAVTNVSNLTQCAGLPRPSNEWLGCGAFGIKVGTGWDEAVPCSARWHAQQSALEVHIIQDLAKDTDYAFILTVRNPGRGQMAAVPTVELQGKVPIVPKRLMDRNGELPSKRVWTHPNLHDIDDSVKYCMVCKEALPQWYRWSGQMGVPGNVDKSIGLFSVSQPAAPNGNAMPLKILQSRFLSIRENKVRECGIGESCGAWVWQSDPDPGSPNNVITIKFGLSVPLLVAANASIHIKGLRNAVKSAGIHALEGVVVEDDISEFDNGFFFTRCSRPPLRVSGSPGGADNTWEWRKADESAVFHLKSDLSPGVWYSLQIKLQNPMVPQPSPASLEVGVLRIEVRTSARESDPLENSVSVMRPGSQPGDLGPGQYPVLEIKNPGFIVKTIGQSTAIPSSRNLIRVTIATNVPLRVGTCVRISGFDDGKPGAVSTKNVTKFLDYNDAVGEPWSQIAPTPKDALDGTKLGQGIWDGDALTFCLVSETTECTIGQCPCSRRDLPCLVGCDCASATQYEFSFELVNPSQAQLAKSVRIESTDRIMISPVLMDTDGRSEGIFEPLRVLQMRFVYTSIGQSTRFPGAMNTITVTMGILLPLNPDMLPEFSLSGLVGSQTTGASLELGKGTGCVRECTDLECSRRGAVLGGCCAARGGMSPIVGSPCTVQGRFCVDQATFCPTAEAECHESEMVGGKCVQSLGCWDVSMFSTTGRSSVAQAGMGDWHAETGTLTVRAIKRIYELRNFTFSIQLQNPVNAQAGQSVQISLNSGDNQLVAPELVKPDKYYPSPPLEVDAPSFLMAAAKQSNANPCQLNTITVTLALNVPVRKGLKLELQGLDGAIYSTPEGEMWTEINIVDTPNPALSEINVRGTFTPVSEIFGFRLRVEAGRRHLSMNVTGQPNVDHALIAAGSPFAFSYTVFNPRVGQAAPTQYQVRGVNARVGDSLPFDLPAATITGCVSFTEDSLTAKTPEPGTAVPLFVYVASFDTLRVAQSQSAPNVANVITVTFSTNVPLSRRCQIVITITGLTNATGVLPTYTQPGMAGSKWRSDACPVAARDILALEPANAARPLSRHPQTASEVVTNVSLYGATPFYANSNQRFHARGGPLVSAPGVCGDGALSAVLESCRPNMNWPFPGWGDEAQEGRAQGMCLFDDKLYSEGHVQEWQRREALLALFRGQKPPAPAYQRSQALPGLGDGICDSSWNCSDYSWDLGDCLPRGSEADMDETAGTAFWNETEKSIKIFLREDTTEYTEYAFSFQLTNPPRLSQSPDIKMETSGIEIKAMRVTWPPLPYPNAGSRALCSTGGSLLQTAQGDLLPQTDATPLNTYSASLIETKVGTSTSFPGPLSSFLPVPVSSFFHSLQVPCLLKSPHAAPCKVP